MAPERIQVVRLASLVTSFLAGSIAYGQAEWVRQSPLPHPPVSAQDIAFSTPERGFIVANWQSDWLLETADGGQTWHRFDLGTGSFNAIEFLDESYGWLVGNNGGSETAYRTSDGGATWEEMTSAPAGSWYGIEFLTPTFGWITGNGPIAVTHDGGDSWTLGLIVDGSMFESLSNGDFRDEQVGLARGEFGIWRTTDGGASWTRVHASPGARRAIFIDDNVALATTGSGILRSTDAGQTWSSVPAPGLSVSSLFRFDATHVLAWGPPFEEALYSDDAGLTWTQVSIGQASYAIHVRDATTAFGLGVDGSIFSTTDAGLTWSRVFTGPTYPLWAADFRSATEGFAVGNNGLILRTTDGGATWDYYSNGIWQELEDIQMFDERRGLAVGAFGTLLRTTDGGNVWTPSRPGFYLGGDDLRGICLLGENFAFAVGFGTFIKSLDGGLTWERAAPSGLVSDYWDVHFETENEGWAVAVPAQIVHTTDGGDTWTRQFLDGGFGLVGIDFVDATHGWASGPVDVIMKTVDGGDNWFFVSIPRIPQQPGTIWDVDFVDQNVGWIVGNWGYIARTEDGGTTWESQQLPSLDHISEINALSSSEAWVSSHLGTVYHTTDAGQTWILDPTGFPGESFNGIDVTPGGSVYVAGAGGVILKRLSDTIPGDIDGDGDVDLGDLATLLAAYGTCDGDPGFDPAADLDASGCIGLGDLAILLASYTG